LLATNSKGQHRSELDNLENLAKKHKFNLSTARKQKNEEDTPLLIAAKEGNLETAHKLLSNKSTFDTRRTCQDSVGKTALHYFVELSNSAEVVNLLLNQWSWSQLGSNAYNPTCQQDHDGNTPVHLLAQSANLALLDAINKCFSSWMSHGVYKQLNAASLITNNEGKTPIMVAALEHPDKPELIQYFGVAMGYKEHDPEIKLYQDLANAIVSKNKEQIQERLLAVNRGKTWKNIDVSAETLLKSAPKRIRKAF
ncbi:MAG TPA: ankyrin repeat domain-containing protein, partial [Candidatus Berkiella sp.]|nr:ankyrin repeat domain-containing protein [Candidatus Berkiella sp.]